MEHQEQSVTVNIDAGLTPGATYTLAEEATFTPHVLPAGTAITYIGTDQQGLSFQIKDGPTIIVNLHSMPKNIQVEE